MTDLKLIKDENKRLFKELKVENRKLMNDIMFYLNQFYIKDTEYHLIKNQILKDFHIRIKDKKSVWESIDDPKEYCDTYLVGYEKKDISVFGVFKNLLPVLMSTFFALLFSYGYSRRFAINVIDSSMLEVRGNEILAVVMVSLLPLITYFEDQRKMFVRNKIRNSKELLIFLFGVFAYVLVGKFLNEMVVLVLPKFLFIIGLGLSFIWMLVRRIMNYNRT